MNTPTTTDAVKSDFELTTLEVDGMTCISCSIRIRVALGRLDGVRNARVSLDPPLVLVQHDRSRSDTAALEDAVREAGYTARPVPDQDAALTHFDVEAMMAAANAPELDTVGVERLRSAFNVSRDRVRVLALVSPTCEICVQGYQVIKQVFEEHESDRLRGFVLWLPMLAGDDSAVAHEQAGALEDARITLQGWDGDRAIGTLLGRSLRLDGPAWDVYLLFDVGVAWEGGSPPEPSFWMHQLDEATGADQTSCLDPAAFSSEVARMLERASS